MCYGLYSTTNSAGIERVAEEKSSVKNRPLVKNENVCIILYTGIRLPRTALYLIFYVFLIFGTNVINTARPSTPRRSKMPVRGEQRDPFKQHCTRGNSRLSLPVASQKAEAIRDRAVKQRDESNGRTANANRTCKTALGMYTQ